MFTFVKNTHMDKPHNKNKIVITYSVSEIILGILLVAIVSFYIYNYLTNAFNAPSQNFPGTMMTPSLGGKNGFPSNPR